MYYKERKGRSKKSGTSTVTGASSQSPSMLPNMPIKLSPCLRASGGVIEGGQSSSPCFINAKMTRH